MNRQQYEKKMARIIKSYEAKQEKLHREYNYYYDSAMTAADILRVQQWWAQETDRINRWYGKSIRELTEMGWTA